MPTNLPFLSNISLLDIKAEPRSIDTLITVDRAIDENFSNFREHPDFIGIKYAARNVILSEAMLATLFNQSIIDKDHPLAVRLMEIMSGLRRFYPGTGVKGTIHLSASILEPLGIREFLDSENLTILADMIGGEGGHLNGKLMNDCVQRLQNTYSLCHFMVSLELKLEIRITDSHDFHTERSRHPDDPYFTAYHLSNNRFDQIIEDHLASVKNELTANAFFDTKLYAPTSSH